MFNSNIRFRTLRKKCLLRNKLHSKFYSAANYFGKKIILKNKNKYKKEKYIKQKVAANQSHKRNVWENEKEFSRVQWNKRRGLVEVRCDTVVKENEKDQREKLVGKKRKMDLWLEKLKAK